MHAELVVYPIVPVPAPRMTAADQWKRPPRPRVARYFAFRDEVRLRKVVLPRPYRHVIFVLPVSPSWKQRLKDQHEGMPHEAVPDRDNLEKALLDSVFGNDSHIWDGRTTKLWGREGMLIISARDIPITLPFDLSPFYAAAKRSHRDSVQRTHQLPL